MHKIGILGHPIKHSLSPKIHNYWLKEMGINGKYNAIETPINNLKKTIENLNNKGYIGLNLTIPLKEEALKYINKKNKTVDIIGAANVLIFSKKGYIEGKNTDVYGFKKSILDLVKNKKKETAAVIGSGGAARAIVYVLIKMNFKKIILFNRTKKNAEIIKNDFQKKFAKKIKTKINCENLKKMKNSIE